MTEISVKEVIFLPDAAHHPVDWRAFIFAAVLTPFVFALSGALGLLFGALFTSVAAVLSIPAYLLFGLPTFYYVITRYGRPTGWSGAFWMAIAGLMANAGSLPLAYYFQLIQGSPISQAQEDALIYAGLGLLCAPIMAVIFGLIFGAWARKVPNDKSKPPKETRHDA